MEDATNPRIPPRISAEMLNNDLERICEIIKKMADPDIFVWLNRKEIATDVEISRAATIVADRLCGAVSDPIIRNAQEKRQAGAGIRPRYPVCRRCPVSPGIHRA